MNVAVDFSAFTPSLEGREHLAWCVRLLLANDSYAAAYALALDVKVRRDPVGEVRAALDEIVRQGLSNETATSAASHFASCLLDGKDDVRQATLARLADWPHESAFRSVRRAIAPMLSATELDMLALALPASVRAGLASREPAQIGEATADLCLRMAARETFPVPAFGTEILEPFGDAVPEDVQVRMFDLMLSYPTFVPALDAHRRLENVIDLLLRYGSSYVAVNLAQALVHRAAPQEAVREALEMFARRGVATEAARRAAAHFVSHLLSFHPEVAPAISEGLASEALRELRPDS